MISTVTSWQKDSRKSIRILNISEIFIKEKHLSEPKKYKKEDSWDAMSEPQPQGNNSKKYWAKNEEDRGQYKKPKRN